MKLDKKSPIMCFFEKGLIRFMTRKIKITSKKKFINSVLEIRKIIETHRLESTISKPKVIPKKTEILKKLILSEIYEIITIFEMMYKSIEKIDESNIKMDKLRKRLPQGTIDRSTPEGKEFVVATNEYMEKTTWLKVYIKMLYEWLYHLKELLESNKKIHSLISKPLWLKLQWYCEFRNKLVTHKKKAQVYLMEGARFSSEWVDFEILMTPFVPPKSAVKELNTLFNQCAENLPEKEATVNNFFERCRILYHNLDILPSNQKSKVKSFIEKYGTISDKPIHMVEYIKDLVKELIPKLAHFGA